MGQDVTIELLNRLSAAEANEKVLAAAAKRMHQYVRHMAGQSKTDEMDEDQGGDFEGAYDSMIEDAREALHDPAVIAVFRQ